MKIIKETEIENGKMIRKEYDNGYIIDEPKPVTLKTIDVFISDPEIVADGIDATSIIFTHEILSSNEIVYIQLAGHGIVKLQFINGVSSHTFSTTKSAYYHLTCSSHLLTGNTSILAVLP